MEVAFLDTNIIIRFITQDNPDHAARAHRFLQEVEAGKRNVTTSEGVIVEAIYVLSSKRLYNLSRQEIQRHLTNVLSLQGVKLSNKKVYLRALELYANSTIDFVDALTIAQMRQRKLTTIISFDRDFDGIPNIKREEPEKAEPEEKNHSSTHPPAPA